MKESGILDGITELLRNYRECITVSTADFVLNHIWKVLVKDGEQFVAGEVKELAKGFGVVLKDV